MLDEKKGLIISAIVAIFVSVMFRNPLIGALIFVFALLKYSPSMLNLKKGKKGEPETVEVKQKHKIFEFRKSFSFWLAGIIILVLLYYFRPFFHSMFMAFYMHPALLFFILCAVLFGIALKFKKLKVSYVFGALAALFFVALMFDPLIVQQYVVSGTNYDKQVELPDSEGLRIVPKAVAGRYLEDSLQKSREKGGGLDIISVDNKLKWTSPRVPDGAILFFTQKVNGLLVADADTSERKTGLITERLPIGEEIGVFDNIYWKIFKTDYINNIDEIYYLFEGDSVLTIANVVKYRFKFPVMVPYFAGIFVIQGENIEYVPAEQVPDLPYMEGNWAYPESLARLYVDSYKYHLGIWNAWVLHKDQIEITDVYGQDNRQPFLMPTVDGMKWIVATEPYGNSYGVFKIFLVDALTGDIGVIEMDEDRTLTGPVRVVSYVKKQFPTIDWATARVIEPRPYVIQGTLYWMLSITPIDYAGITYTVLVNADTNEVIGFTSDEAVEKFVLRGEIVEGTEEETVDKEGLIQTKLSELEFKLGELKDLLSEQAV